MAFVLRSTASWIQRSANMSAMMRIAPRAMYSAPASAPLDEKTVTERIFDVVKAVQGVDPQKLTPTAHFQKDLGLDSLSVVEAVLAVEEEFAIEIPDADADKIETIADAVKYIVKHPHAK
eukprot:TRINITY_DN16051_c0_g1_i1.p1 TRINITY_DN16051_c0_g1~~TRINITY_DN16051_c0_g1_i1.p1  ORF type:complete len:120 (+),score=17.93 TRINITY_DN16051_c0_g1_i1:39-398(+)